MPAAEAVVEQPVNQPAEGTGNEGAKPDVQSGAQPAGATSRPAGQPDNRAYFDPKEHVPRSRLNEISTKARESEAAYKSQIDSLTAKIQALAGVTPQSKEEQEFASARQVLEKLYPGLKDLSDGDFVKRLRDSTSQLDQIKAANDQQWQNYGTRAFRELETLAKSDLGTDLTPRGKRMIRAALIDFVQSDEEAAQSYIEQDPDFIKNFWAEYRKDFIDPVRRSTNAGLAARADRLRMPRGGGSAPNAPAPKKVDFKNEDEVLSAAWDTVQQRMSR